MYFFSGIRISSIAKGFVFLSIMASLSGDRFIDHNIDQESVAQWRDNKFFY